MDRLIRFHFAIAVLLCVSVILQKPAIAKEHIVKVLTDVETLQLKFEPKILYIKSGDTVTWVNAFEEDHNMMTYPDGFPAGAKGFISPYLGKKGEKWSHTFTKSGTYKYHCLPHIMLGMRGIIVVDQETKLTEFHEPSKAEVKAYRDAMLEFFDPEDFENMPKYVRDRLVKK